MQTRILHHGRRPRPARIPKMRRLDVADLLAGLLIVEIRTAKYAGEHDQAAHLDGLCARAEAIALREAS